MSVPDDAPYDRSNIFARILRGEIPSDRVYEDDEFIAFRDIAPLAPTHIVLIPRGEPPTSPAGVEPHDAAWLGRMIVAATEVARRVGLDKDGYRLVMNSGAHADQSVRHLHVHIVGGHPLGPFA